MSENLRGILKITGIATDVMIKMREYLCFYICYSLTYVSMTNAYTICCDMLAHPYIIVIDVTTILATVIMAPSYPQLDMA